MNALKEKFKPAPLLPKEPKSNTWSQSTVEIKH